MADPISFDGLLSDVDRNARDTRLAERRLRGGDEPPSGIETRMARLEVSVAHIERDVGELRTDLKTVRSEMRADVKELQKADETNFRLLFGALIAVALGLAGLMAKGFHWL